MMWLAIVQQYWKQLAVISSVLLLCFYIAGIKNELKEQATTIINLTAESKLNEIQKETLRSAIIEENERVESQRIDAVKKLEAFKTAQYTINAKYERERVRVSDLNGSTECDAIREIIKGSL